LWSINKKKPIHTIPIAHGLNPPLKPEDYSSEQDPNPNPPCPPQPREITALHAIPYSDLFFSGSYDGYVRVWKVSEDKKKIIPLGRLGVKEAEDLEENVEQAHTVEVAEDVPVKGVINGIDVFETEDRKSDTLTIAVCTGKEMRLGRWMKGPGKNGGYVIKVRKGLLNASVENSESK
jgi:ribosomal RNA-processing protein 9